MKNLSKKQLIIFSGSIWLAVGAFLLYLGINFIMGIPGGTSYAPLFTSLLPLFSEPDYILVSLVCLALLIGYYKGRYILRKSALRGIAHIESLSGQISIRNMYSKGYWALIGLMMGLGMGMKYLGIPPDIRGFVDIAVGSALIQGSLVYFRSTCGKVNPS